MARQRHLNNAPISEALIDIRCSLPAKFDPSHLDSLSELIKHEYPKKESMHGMAWGIEFNMKEQQVGSQTVDHGMVGYIYRSEHGSDVLQARRDGFTFSRLKPYEDWPKLRDQARVLWNRYVSVAEPESVTRVALRYINRLNLSLAKEKFDFDDFLTAAPKIPAGLPQVITSFFYRVVIPEPAIGAVAIVNQAVESIIDPGTVPIILDIDVILQRDFSPGSDDIWHVLERLHSFKNDIFFSYITEKTAEIYE